MKNANQSSRCTLTTALQKNRSGLLSLAAVLLCGLGVPTQAQNITRIAPEKGFTIAPNVQTPIVLKTKPDAACDLHGEGVSEKTQSLKFYANGEGYVRIHANPSLESEDGIPVQLDCAVASGKTVRYPLRLRVSSSPKTDMPAPPSVIPAPKGSRVRPALTETEAQQLSDDELVNRWYPKRPDAVEAPAQYADWLEQVTRPTTILPPHSVSHSDVFHHVQGGVEDGPGNSFNWSGYVSNPKATRTYMEVDGVWNVPEIVGCESNNATYSSVWVGLDGFGGLTELVQAGTEQDTYWFLGICFANYYAWTELLPNQPTAQEQFSVNPSDSVGVQVYIGDSTGHEDQNGQYAWFAINDYTQGQGVFLNTYLDGTKFNGKQAEWIVERPCLSNCTGGPAVFAELSDYYYVQMRGAAARTTKNKIVNYGNTSNLLRFWLYNDYKNGNDNYVLSKVFADTKTEMTFDWFNFH